LLVKLTLLATIIGTACSVGIYEQCAGEGYGTFPCNAGLTCFRRNVFYSSCQYTCPRNVGWECEAYMGTGTGTGSIIAAEWDQCGGDGWVGATGCSAGYACYARSVFYSQCRPFNDCPADWSCSGSVAVSTVSPSGPVVLPIYAKCNDVGTAVCPSGTACYRNTALYSECRPSCPATWACETDLAAYAKCNDVGNAFCPSGTACFRNNDLYSECRPSCPPTWACETDVLGVADQCGGEGYVGITRCAEGLRCYARGVYYAHCAASCPGAGWIC